MKKPLLIKSLLLLCALMVGNVAWATDYSYTFSSQQYTADGAKTLNGVSWTMAGTGGAYFGYDGTKGQQFGSGNKPYSALSLSTSGISGTITQVVVNTSGASSIAGTVAVSVGSTNFQCNSKTTASLSATATAYTFTGSASGDIVISWAQTSSKAIYVKSITVTYSGGGGSSVDAPSFSPIAGAVDAGTTVTLTQAAADQIRYTTDGTDPTKTTGTVYSTPIEITTATTIKAIAIKGDDVSSVATAVYTINVASPTFNLEGGSSYMQGTNITITSAGNTIYYNLTTDGSTPGNPTNASTEYTAPIVLGSGTTKIKAIAYDTYGNASSVITRTYTGMALASLPFSWTGTSSAGKDELDAETGVALSLGSNYAESNAPYRLKFDGVGKNVTIYTDAKPENVYFTAKLFNAASTGSKMKVQGSDDGITFTDIEEFTIKGAASATFEFTTSNAFAATHRAVKLVMSSKDQNVAVGSIIISSAIPVTITDADYATFVSDKKTDFAGTGITAYTAKVNGNSVTLTSIEKVPANTPVVVYKDVAATTTFAVPVTTADIAEVSENDLWVSDGTTATSANNVYVLGNNTEGIGFYKWTGASSLSAGKVYLNVPAESRDYLTFAFEDQATGVGASLMNSEKCKVNSDIFDLQGRRVVNPTKGLYIVNGKKVIVK